MVYVSLRNGGAGLLQSGVGSGAWGAIQPLVSLRHCCMAQVLPWQKQHLGNMYLKALKCVMKTYNNPFSDLFGWLNTQGEKQKTINYTIWWDELCTIIARQIFLLRGRVVYSLFCCFFFFSLLCKQIFTQVFVAMTEEAALALVGWMEGGTEPADSCTWWSFCVPSKEGSSTFLGSAKWGRLYSPHLGPVYLEEDLHELY